MHRHGIRAEGIEDDQAIVVVRCFPQAQAGIAEQHFRHSGLAPGQKRKEARVLGDAFDGRVDLVVGPVFAGLRVTGQGADAESGDSHARRQLPLALLEQLENLADWPGAVEVRQGLAIRVELAIGGEPLHAVQGAAVVQPAKNSFAIVIYPNQAEEISLRIKGTT